MTKEYDQYIKESMENRTFTIVKGKPAPPNIVLPKFVGDRIDLFREDVENGLSFFGALEFILWQDDEHCSKEYELGGENLLEDVKPTKEFENWVNEWLVSYSRQEKIALALVYGYDIEGEKKQ
jgi:hypothetical protein